jgi:hypothetical protein
MPSLLNNRIFLALTLTSTLALSACGGGGGGDSTPVPNASVGGLWSGPATSIDGTESYELFGAITETGRFVFISETGLDIGNIFTTGNSADGGFDSYLLTGTEVSGLLTGNVAQRQRFNGTIFTLDNTEAGTFDLAYDNAYEVSTSLADVEGTYTASFTSGFSETYTFDADGTFTGSDTNGCIYAGSLAIINANYAVLELNGTVSACTDEPTLSSFNGLLAFERANTDTNDLIIAAGAGEAGAFLALLEKTD